jgi:hypothetical protein
MEALQLRKTHRYVGTFQHEDEWEDVGTFRIIARGEVIDGAEDDYCEPTSQVLIAEVDAKDGIASREIKTALENSHTRAGCHHEWDCCGCRSYHATAEHIGGVTWRITVTSSRNF